MLSLVRLLGRVRIARRNIATAKAQMHQQLGESVPQVHPNSVVLDRLGLLEPEAETFIAKMHTLVSYRDDKTIAATWLVVLLSLVVECVCYATSGCPEEA